MAPRPQCSGGDARLFNDGDTQQLKALVSASGPAGRATVCRLLRGAGIEAAPCGDRGEVLSRGTKDHPDLVVIVLGDFVHEDLELVRELRERTSTPVVVVGPQGDEPTLVR